MQLLLSHMFLSFMVRTSPLMKIEAEGELVIFKVVRGGTPFFN